MKTYVLIPARLASTRFPRKVLTPITYPDGTKYPLLWGVYQQVLSGLESFKQWDSDGFTPYVVTSDLEIYDEVRLWPGNALFVDESQREMCNGTERCRFALKALGCEYDSKVRIINIQADEFIHPDMIVELARLWPVHRLATLVTPYMELDNQEHPNEVKAVITRDHKALYFSRASIPRVRGGDGHFVGYLHLGVYMYSTALLRRYVGWQPSSYEITEGLEQLRFIQNGETMGVHVTDLPAISINVIEDVDRLEQYLLTI